MKNWEEIDRSIGGFEVTLVNGEKLWGSFPVDYEVSVFGSRTVGFLPWDKKEELFGKTENGKSISVSVDRALRFIKPIPYESIKSIKIAETELGGMLLVGNKPIPEDLEVSLENHGKPGFVKVTYKIPGNPKTYEIGELEIIKGELILPLKLVFVSYAREDQIVVEGIIRKLNDEGILTWFDENELLPGDHWESKIEIAIEKSENALVFFSNKTLEREGYKNKEIRYILNHAKSKALGSRYIIPVLLDDCKPPREFTDLHWLSHGKAGWLEKLVKVLK